MAPSGRGTEPWCWWASCDGTSVVRRHRGGEWVTGSLPDLATMPLPAREFSPRSLVGMSQGARKRQGRHDANTAVTPPPPLTRSMVYDRLRRILRLGERLRPCKGCPECLGYQVATYGSTAGRWYMHSRECIREKQRVDECRGRWVVGTPCDGSGVLPAKRHRRCGWWLQTRTAQNATLRCGMPLTFGGWLDCQHCGGSGWLMGRGE